MQVKILRWTAILVALLVVAGCAGVLLPNYEAMKIEPVESTDNSVKDAELADRAPASTASIQVPQSSSSQPNPNLYKDGYKEPKEQVDSVTNQLYTASMAFSAPDKANIKQDITIQLLIDPSKEMQELVDRLTEPGNRHSAKVKISKVIIASLSAPDFTIEKVTPEEQAVAQTAPTEWLWTLTPKSTGKNEVKLTITAIVKVDSKEYKYHIKTYEKTIVIEVKPQQVIYDWLAKYWQWLFSTLLLPIGLWLYKRNKKVELPTT